MKRNNGYMYPTQKNKIASKYTCSLCGKELLPKEAYCYVDANNFAITQNARAYYKNCYKKKYGDK